MNSLRGKTAIVTGANSGMGFRDQGQSGSTWGGGKWHEMDIFLNL